MELNALGLHAQSLVGHLRGCLQGAGVEDEDLGVAGKVVHKSKEGNRVKPSPVQGCSDVEEGDEEDEVDWSAGTSTSHVLSRRHTGWGAATPAGQVLRLTNALPDTLP